MDKPSTIDREAYAIDGVRAVLIGPGCVRRDIPGTTGARSWIVDIDAGCEWPHDDVHGASGEVVFVLSGELIDAGRRYGAGTCIVYAPHSVHRPRSERGVRLFGFNVTSRRGDGHVD